MGTIGALIFDSLLTELDFLRAIYLVPPFSIENIPLFDLPNPNIFQVPSLLKFGFPLKKGRKL